MMRALHIVLVAGVLSLLANGAFAACAEEYVDLRGPWGQARFSVEIVDTEETRARGLMHRESLPRSAGMLFIYDAPTEPSFWMRNTLIPLDMIFVDPTGQVTRIHRDAIPHDITPIPGGPNVLMVLEINGGLSQMLGMVTGSEMRHPRLDQAAALWPCE
ncbi:hypothetical protein LY56_00309 [Roseinatronobacter thiooxidans]|uniref:DUF192 domain-containing protein n=2 Tax=Roseinatronobacter thiooxidans TaxID=121821 RepID=A0A2W7R209_9RHOB|nr:DUF192 domain-containing protein [Roseinatronobacter thiooxidans]PZX48159.1 hypothetical protein LY56_00309 [Roseinatronobacter thiooxidans]